MITLKQIINKTNNHLDFWELLEKAGGRLLFEEYVANYLKATLPGETYWLGEDVVPPAISEKYAFSNILIGKRSLGSDIINVHNGIATAYESKYFDDNESIKLKTVSDKLQVIRKTKIKQLIFTTNAVRPSKFVTEWADELGFLFNEFWMRKDVFEAVKKYINTHKQVVYKALKPRDDFFVSALEQLETDFSKRKKSDLTRIFQEWPTSTGKGSFPRLAYDKIFEPAWDREGHPINLVLNPTLAVLKTNLIKHIEHDLALKNNCVHVIFSGDVTKGARNTEELQNLRTMAVVFSNKIEFIEFIQQNTDKTIWVHSTLHSYSRPVNGLAQMMKSLDKEFYFGHLDEVHHMILPDHSMFSDGLKDDICIIRIRIMTSANKRIPIGKGASFDMSDPNFCDIKVKELSEKQAEDLGYKRKPKLINYIYGTEDFPIEWFDMFEKGYQPLLKHKSSRMVVPMNWYMAVDSLLRFRVEYSGMNHTKLTLNTIEECIEFQKFFQAIRKDILGKIVGNDKDLYDRLISAKIMVADTHKNSTVKILREVEGIPDNFKDSFLIHCRLLGEGWDPENGWIDSSMFVSPTHSEIRIYQDFSRGSRIGDGSKPNNYLIMCHLKDDDQVDGVNPTQTSQFNGMFGRIKDVIEILQIGKDEISEKVIMKEFKRIPNKKRGPRQTGEDEQSFLDEIDSDFFADAFDRYIKDGRYYVFGAMINDIIDDYFRLYTERHLENKDIEGASCFRRRHLLKKQLIVKYIEFFQQYKPEHRKTHLNHLINGEDSRVSSDQLVKIAEFKDKVTRVRQERDKFMRKYWQDYEYTHNDDPDQQDLKLAYIEQFGVPAQSDYSDIIGREHLFWRTTNKRWEGLEQIPNIRDYIRQRGQWDFDDYYCSLTDEEVGKIEKKTYTHSDLT